MPAAKKAAKQAAQPKKASRAKKRVPENARSDGKPSHKLAAKPLSEWDKWKASPEESCISLCERIQSGESLTDIARALGVSFGSLSNWIAADTERSARAREARSASAQAYDDLALQNIRQAADPFELSRAKEEAHHLRWRASKINPREYGDKLDIKQEVTMASLTDEQVAAQLAALMKKAGIQDGPSDAHAGRAAAAS